MLVHDPYKLISGPSLSTNSRINNSYEKEMTHKREGSMGLLCTNNSMGFSLKYDPCPQFLLYHSWESSIPTTYTREELFLQSSYCVAHLLYLPCTPS